MVVSLSMEWHHVLFANFPVDPESITAHLPPELAVDTFDSQAWLSVVPFTNRDVRPSLLPEGRGITLPELNLRTYVTHPDGPGVYFFSLDADGKAAVLGARVFHHLPYYFAAITLTKNADEIHFTCRRTHPGARPVSFTASYTPDGDPSPAEPDSLAAFLTERYRYYTEDRDGRLRYATIEHDPWPVSNVTAAIDADMLFRANHFEPPSSSPELFYSPGVTTVASRSKRV